ncbi:pyruvate dehydrogenase [Phaeacidiphilus oryzae]|uniref:pyruvate dehydrogenase n=1 Tax=Phaeacidiphilus oryzae TaxID=348818 RepID=UPI00055A431C|nr:pyruvate dehydrogenase [Phaeacidiphilus oryzae]
MADSSVAEQMITVLRQAGVKRIYGVVGDSLNPVVDAIRRSDGAIEWVHVRNEEAGAFAAAAEAETTGRLAVCAGSCGPGNTHLIQGLYDAHRNNVPVLALASHIPSAQIGTGYFQETHPTRVFEDCSGYCEMAGTPAQLPRVLRTAIQHTLGGGGVSVIAFPGDVAALAPANPTGESSFLTEFATPVPRDSQVEALAELLNRARKPVLFAGAGVRNAHGEVMQLAGTVQAPVGHSLRGKEWIQFDNPYDVGMSGLLGYGACDEALREADLLVLLGTDFPYDTFLPGRNTVQIDHDATRLGRRTPLDLAVHGDVGAVLRAVQPLLKQRQDRSFLDSMLRKHARALENVVGAYTRNIERHTPIHPEYVAYVLDEVAADDAVFTVDTGMNNVWAARYLTPNGRRRVIGSFLHGSMANALPHAMGAQLAHPGRQVVSMSGDGGLGMLMGELLTVAKYRERMPVKIVVFNNGALGMIKLEMMVSGYPEYEIDNGAVDYASIARVCGFHGVRVTQPGEVRDALTEAFAAPGPALVDVVTDPNALSLPPHITAAQVKGFALAAGRTVLDGGVGKMIDMARSNLRNIPRP